MARSRFVLLTILMFSISGSLLAQEVWNLERCVSFALENNLDIRDQMLSREQVEINLEQSKMQRYPNLNSNMGHNYNFGRAIDPFTNQFVNQRIQSNSLSLSTSMVIYNGNRIRNSIERNEVLLEKNKYDVALVKNQIMNNVALAYVNVIYAYQALRTAQMQDSTTQAQLGRVQKLIDAGRLARSEILNLEAQQASDRLSIQRASAQVETATLNLKLLMQMDPNQTLEVEIPRVDLNPQAPPNDLEDVLRKALDELPEMQSARTQLAVTALNEEIAKAGAMPRLSVFANMNSVYSESRKETFNPRPASVEVGYVEGSNAPVLRDVFEFDTRTTPFATQIKDNFGQSVGLNLSVPIYNNHQVRSDIAGARIGQEQAKIILERTRNAIRSDITAAYLNMENAHLAFQAASESEKAQRESYEFNEKRYVNGVITGPELQVNRNNWTQAQIEKDRALYEWLFAKAQLEFYRTGKISIR
ncbi:MAG: TolC family protein [Flavobacteriales bacterium]|nr:TolC family protein [Flavobacteriales bacterium]